MDMITTSTESELAGFASNVRATAHASTSVIKRADRGAARGARALMYLCATIGAVAAWGPRGGTWRSQSQPGWQYQSPPTQSTQSTRAYEDDDDDEDEASAPVSGD